MHVIYSRIPIDFAPFERAFQSERFLCLSENRHLFLNRIAFLRLKLDTFPNAQLQRVCNQYKFNTYI